MEALLVEANPSDVSPLESALQNRFSRPARAGTLEQCLRALKANTFDVILLDLDLPDSQGLDTLAAVHRQSPGTPIVVLSRTEEQQAGVDALRLGAQDFLYKERIEPEPLERAIRNAVERLRQKAHVDAQQQTREVQSVSRVSRHAGTTVTSQIYGGLDLRERDPRRFLEFQERYFKLMDTAVEERTYRVIHSTLVEDLQSLAHDIALLRGGPRDVIEIHVSSIKNATENAPAPRTRAYIEEGRVLVLELMGFLAGFYRNYYPAFRSGNSRGEV